LLSCTCIFPGCLFVLVNLFSCFLKLWTLSCFCSSSFLIFRNRISTSKHYSHVNIIRNHYTSRHNNYSKCLRHSSAPFWSVRDLHDLSLHVIPHIRPTKCLLLVSRVCINKIRPVFGSLVPDFGTTSLLLKFLDMTVFLIFSFPSFSSQSCFFRAKHKLLL
jgi:hypothetical protein